MDADSDVGLVVDFQGSWGFFFYVDILWFLDIYILLGGVEMKRYSLSKRRDYSVFSEIFQLFTILPLWNQSTVYAAVIIAFVR